MYTGLAALFLSLIYYLFFREHFFDMSVGTYFTIASYYLWLIMAGFLFLLSGIYYMAVRGRLRIRAGMVLTHFVFILLFLLFFLVFSNFNAPLFEPLTGGLPFWVLVSVYGTIFLTDLILLGLGLIIMTVNLLSSKKQP